jgi:hypothetical protein
MLSILVLDSTMFPRSCNSFNGSQFPIRRAWSPSPKSTSCYVETMSEFDNLPFLEVLIFETLLSKFDMFKIFLKVIPNFMDLEQIIKLPNSHYDILFLQ